MNNEFDNEDSALRPEDLRPEYNNLYGRVGPRLAGTKEWPSSWIPESSGLGFLDWYTDYHNGKRTDDDENQIRRWKSFKARHGAQFKKNPTPRRAYALRLWGIDPLKLLDSDEERESLSAAMKEYKDNAEKEYNEKKAAFEREELNAIATWLNNHHGAGIPTGTADEQTMEASIMDFVTNGLGAVNPAVMQAGVDGLERAEQAVAEVSKEASLKPGDVIEAVRSGNFGLLRKMANARLRKVPELPKPEKFASEFVEGKCEAEPDNTEEHHFLSVKEAEAKPNEKY